MLRRELRVPQLSIGDRGHPTLPVAWRMLPVYRARQPSGLDSLRSRLGAGNRQVLAFRSLLASPINPEGYPAWKTCNTHESSSSVLSNVHVHQVSVLQEPHPLGQESILLEWR